LGGGIGSGKSRVARVLAECGAACLDADQVYHQLLRADPGLARGLADLLGAGVLDAQGRPVRERMREALRLRPQLFPQVDALTHPLVLAELERRLALPEVAGRPFAVIEVPLLFESGLDAWMDLTVYVRAPLEERFCRVRGRSGLSRPEFDALVARQLAPEAAARRADLLLENDAGPAELEQRVAELYREILARLA
jgi:dephospho-CoA kinase